MSGNQICVCLLTLLFIFINELSNLLTKKQTCLEMMEAMLEENGVKGHKMAYFMATTAMVTSMAVMSFLFAVGVYYGCKALF